MTTESKLKEPIAISDKELDEKIVELEIDLGKAAQLQEQALNKRLFLQGQLELLEQLRKNRTLYKVSQEKSK